MSLTRTTWSTSAGGSYEAEHERPGDQRRAGNSPTDCLCCADQRQSLRKSRTRNGVSDRPDHDGPPAGTCAVRTVAGAAVRDTRLGFGVRTLEFDIFMFAQAAADAALTLTPDDEQLLQPVLRGRLVGTGRTDGQEAMVRRSSRHVQPQHSLGAVVEHGGRGASTAAQAAAEAACEAGRRPVVPVVRQERLQSFDSARRTAGVLPSQAAAKGAPSRHLSSLCTLPTCPGRHNEAGSGSRPELHRLDRGSSPSVSRRA